MVALYPRILGLETHCDRAPRVLTGCRSLDPAYTGMRDVVLDKRDMHEELSDCVIGNLAHEKVIVLLLAFVTEPRLQKLRTCALASPPIKCFTCVSSHALSCIIALPP